MSYRTGNDLNSKLFKFYGDIIFVFSEEAF